MGLDLRTPIGYTPLVSNTVGKLLSPPRCRSEDLRIRRFENTPSPNNDVSFETDVFTTTIISPHPTLFLLQ